MLLKISVDLIVRFWTSSNLVSVTFIGAGRLVFSSSSSISAFSVGDSSFDIQSSYSSIVLNMIDISKANTEKMLYLLP